MIVDEEEFFSKYYNPYAQNEDSDDSSDAQNEDSDDSSGPSLDIENCYDEDFNIIPGCLCHSSCSACSSHQWPEQYRPHGCIACKDGSPVEVVNGDGTGYCNGTNENEFKDDDTTHNSTDEWTDDTSNDTDGEPIWYGFFVSDEIGQFAYLATYDL